LMRFASRQPFRFICQCPRMGGFAASATNLAQPLRFVECRGMGSVNPCGRANVAPAICQGDWHDVRSVA
jgi:hypothetical protein